MNKKLKKLLNEFQSSIDDKSSQFDAFQPNLSDEEVYLLHGGRPLNGMCNNECCNSSDSNNNGCNNNVCDGSSNAHCSNNSCISSPDGGTARGGGSSSTG